MARSPKRKIIEHIHSLFTQRFHNSEQIQWNCVLRNGELIVISPDVGIPTDCVIVDYNSGKESLLLACICRRLWTSIYRGVNKNWNALKTSDIKISENMGKKKMTVCTKRQIIDHIHHLFAVQFIRTGQMQWDCVLRDNQIRLIAPHLVLTTDLVIVDHKRKLDYLPLRTLIHQGVNKNWDVLNAVDITIQGNTELSFV